MKNLFILFTFIFGLSAIDTIASPIPANKLFANSALSNLQFSPDEKYISGEVIEDKGKFLSLIDVATNEYTNIIQLDADESITEYAWLDNNSIYVKYLQGRNSFQAVLDIIHKDGVVRSKTNRLTFEGSLVRVKPDSGTLLYGYTSRNSENQKLYEVTVNELKNKTFSSKNLIDDDLRNVFGYFFDENKEMLFALTLDKDAKKVDFHYRPLANKNWQHLFSLTSGKETFIPQHIIDNNTMYVLSNKSTDKVALHKFDIKQQKVTELVYENPKFDLIDSTFDENNQLQSVSFYENGQLNTQYFDQQANLQQAVFKHSFPNKHTVVTATSPSGKFSALYVYASDDPGTRYVYNNETKKAFLLSKVLPNLEGYTLSKTEAFTVESDTGVSVESYLTLPQSDNANGVLLVMPHGGPVGIRDYDGFNPESQYFTSRGFAVLRVNFRGSVGYGKAFLEGGVGQFGLDIEKDITAAVEHVRAKHQFKRSCAIGASYGGYSSVMLAIKHPDQYQCVVGAYGVYDLPLLFNSSNIKATEEFRQMTANAVGKYSAELKATSPVYLSDKIDVPLLLIAGTEDMTAELEHSHRLEYVLKARGRAPETLYYKKTGHGHTSLYWLQHETISTADFLQRTLELPEYESTVTDKKALAALAEDYVTLGDARNWETKIELNKGLAMEYYLRAAKMGSGRASFLVGIKHYDNEEKLASISWFEKAAAANFAPANYMLGLMFTGEDGMTTDLAKSFHYFELANEQGADARARLMMAKALCTGAGVSKDVSRCAELLALADLKAKPTYLQKNEVTKASLSLQSQVIAEIFAETDFNSSELQLLQNMIDSELKIKLNSLSLDDVAAGIIIDSTGSKGKSEIQVAKNIKFNPGDVIGTVFAVDMASKQDNVGLTCNWSYLDAEGNSKSLHNHLLWGNSNNEEWSCTHKILPEDQSTGTYIVTLRDLSDSVLLVKEFTMIQ
ncbi:prolyl oligopeptidase family serine peptidase [Shewanella sp. HN-41]|uniref:prolyl oligopeptidase family serine peptidase n=1 Tax=Shewanella sp. HN-41 TaxID=327275 RepID=UPI0002126304|nr:prolyl oligopeptidase family serine peptidase [Shewanella sp. HN-41]EGM68127.1 hypothetical protein SOHN41_04031 [Shewanella sp. HN-41]